MKRRIVGIALFCLVLLAAIFAGYWDMLNTEKLRIAQEEAASKSGEVATLAEREPASGSPEPTAPATADAASAPTPVSPTFDILRVEPNGSTVMAGKAEAGTTVRLTDGKTVLGEEKVGPGGDFAIVLDSPLPVGEHQIRIEARGADGAAATSRETAIVSVPRPGRENELLAMVETPDRPSRLISVPTGEPQVAAPAAGTGASLEAPTAAAGSSDGSSAPPAASGNPAPEASASLPAPSEPVEGAAPSAVTPGRASTTPSPAAVSATASPEPTAVSATASPEPTAVSPGSAPAPDPARSSNLVVEGPLAVEAVEIEDDTIYVAGRAPAGPTVRVYVDNVFLAEDAGRKTGRFLVSTKSDVSPGDHMVRADQVASDGTVVARVEVPFVKPEGRSMSAVAGADGAAEPGDARISEAAPAARGRAVGSGVAFDGAASPATQSQAVPAVPDPAMAASGGGSDLADTLPSSDAAASAAAVPAPSGSTDLTSVEERSAPSSPSASTETASSAASSEASAGSDIAAARQAPLQAAGARVIIRRGDTLWRISREAYGRGARYTTIYLANGDQIRDPDRIYPGQVFRMPETTSQ